MAHGGDATRLTGDAFRVLVVLALCRVCSPSRRSSSACVTSGSGRKLGCRIRRSHRRGFGRRPSFGCPVSIGLVRRIVGSTDEWRRFPAPFWLFMLANALFTLGNSSDAFLAFDRRTWASPCWRCC